MTRIIRRAGGAAGVALVLVFALAAQAATTNTYYVAAGNPGAEPPFGTWQKAAGDIQTAVDRASADLVPGATECVVLVSNGTYTLNSQIVITNAITLRSLGGRDETFINGNFPATTNRCVFINADATLDGFTITNGYAAATGSTPATTNLGGGIHVYDCGALIRNCTIVLNATLTNGATGNSGWGGGVALGNGTSRLIDCYIASNKTITASTGAGGVFLYNWTGLVANCTVSTNYGASLGSGTGAGIYLAASAAGVISNCVVTRNISRWNAGVHLGGGALMTHCLLANNWSANGKGAVELSVAGAVVRHCTVVSNYAGQASGAGVIAYAGLVENTRILYNRGAGYPGGGLYLGAATVRNCLIAGNKVTGAGLGGGVYMDDEAGSLINCTIVNNQSDVTNAAGIYTIATNKPDIFRNLVVCDNQSTNGTAIDIASATVPNWMDSFAYCLSPGLIEGVNGNRTGDPLFVSAGVGYGTNAVLGDYTPQPGSPCIDAGTNQGWMAFAVDMAGNPRLRPSWSTVDMGAYEAPAPLTGPLACGFLATPLTGAAPVQVAFTGDTSGDTNGLLWRWDFGDGTPADWVTDAAVTHSYAAARTNAYTVTLTVTNAAGESAARTREDCIMVYPAVAYVATNGAHVPPFDTWDKAATSVQAAIDVAGAGLTMVLVSNGVYTVTNEITISKAIAVCGAGTNRDDTVIRGGYPLSTNRCLTISGTGALVQGLTITNGYARLVVGGGINLAANATVRDCRITGNTATGSSASHGGGIAASDGRILNCTIENNATLQVDGGGIYMSGNLVQVSDCVIAGNRSLNYGGGMRLAGGTVTGCVISNNVASVGGGGVYKANSGGATLRNLLVVANQAGGSGGGFYMGLGTISLQNLTIAGNAATNGGGAYLANGSHQGLNCIVALNRASQPGASNDIASATNIVVNFACSSSPDLADGVSNNLTADPRFVRAGSGYGTNCAVGDYHLKVGSPCVDTATNLPWMASATDLDGKPRILGAGPNMGVYEKPVASRGASIMVR